MSSVPVIRIPAESKLDDNQQWENRFEIHSETSDRVYIAPFLLSLSHEDRRRRDRL